MGDDDSVVDPSLRVSLGQTSVLNFERVIGQLRNVLMAQVILEPVTANFAPRSGAANTYAAVRNFERNWCFGQTRRTYCLVLEETKPRNRCLARR